MLKDITLGQYFPGNSFFHKLDPRIKIIAMIIFVVGVFAASSLLSYAALTLFVLICCIVSRISIKVIVKGLKPIIFITVIMGIINLFFTKGENPLVSFWIINIYPEGLVSAVFITLRIICLVAGTGVLLTYTTSPNVLSDAIESLLSPLKLVKIPVHDFAMIMNIALRFIPTIIEETDRIMSAQKARGADFETGSVINRAKALLPVLIPLLATEINRAAELANAMECRCYNGGEGRTRMKEMKISFRDPVFLAIVTAFAVGMFFIAGVKPFGY